MAEPAARRRVGDSAHRAEDAGGMMPLADYEAQGGDPEPEPEVVDLDAPLTRVSDARLVELKAKARAMIEERLKAKRKQRRLMRGGEDW